jgi:AraC family transcriptional regulator, arabinose operon regulatory protein
VKTQFSDDHKPHDQRVKDIIRCLNAQPWLRVHELSPMVGLSQSRLRHLFKHEIGQSVGGYAREIQMNQALQLLLQTRRPLKDIASAVGIFDVANFGRYFKLRFGFTPASYRRRFQRRIALPTQNSQIYQ